MKTFEEFLDESFIDSKTRKLEPGQWYHYSLGNKGKGKAIKVVNVADDHIKIKEEHSDEVFRVPISTFNAKYKGYLTKKSN